MSGLLLVNGDAFDSWMGRARHLAHIRQCELESMVSRVGNSSVASSAWGEHWNRIKSQAEGGEFKRHGTSAIVDVVGALDYKYDIWSYLFDTACYKGIAAKVESAANDSSIERIVLYIDSPGGGHHGCQETADVIWNARQSGKEVVAVVDPEAASAGYWMASQASRIVAIGSAWVGSLGSQIILHSTKRMYDESGIDVELVRAAISPNKNLGHPVEAISDEARAERQAWVDVAGEQFVEHVCRGRGKTREQVLERFGQGSMFFTPQALERGMVDEVGTLEDVVGTASGGSEKKKRYMTSFQSGVMTTNDWRSGAE